jgi:hypothetical protein
VGDDAPVRASVPAIGTLRERPLHASLKRWYARAGDRVEVPVDGYVIDLVRGELLIEIQTRGFATMRAKVADLLARGHRVRVVHPIAVERWLVKVDDAGDVLGRRRSPRRGALVDVVSELVSFPHLVAHPGFELEVLLVLQEEVRRHQPGRCWRRGGWATVERRLLDVVARVPLAHAEDLACLLPPDLPDRFTTAELAEGIGRPRRVAQQLAYCLKAIDLIEADGKRGHSAEYRRAAPRPAA